MIIPMHAQCHRYPGQCRHAAILLFGSVTLHFILFFEILTFRATSYSTLTLSHHLKS